MGVRSNVTCEYESIGIVRRFGNAAAWKSRQKLKMKVRLNL
jgi:hypothetical protein